jgi:hypothetical protein
MIRLAPARPALLALLLTALLALSSSAPALALSVSPAAAERGESLPVNIYTPGLSWSEGVAVHLGSGIITESVTVIAPGLLEVRAAISPGATIGPRDVTIIEGEVTVVGSEAFGIAVLDEGGTPGSQALPTNAFINPGFETGNLNGWIPATWSISTVLPHGGSFCAYDPGGSGGGGGCIRQNFNPPLDSNQISAFTFWLRQIDDAGIAQVIVFHQNAGSQVGVAFTNNNDTWTFEDFTSLVVPNDLVTGCHVCGFGLGTPDPDDSWADDFLLDFAGATPVEAATWGRIKAALR